VFITQPSSSGIVVQSSIHLREVHNEVEKVVSFIQAILRRLILRLLLYVNSNNGQVPSIQSKNVTEYLQQSVVGLNLPPNLFEQVWDVVFIKKSTEN
jgi:hypothetical protein